MMSQQFDSIFEECIEHLRTGSTPDQCLADHPSLAGRLEPMLVGAAGLLSARAEPGASFRQEARARVLGMAQELAAQSSSPLSAQEEGVWQMGVAPAHAGRRAGARSWRFRVAAAATAFTLVAGSTATAAAASAPDSPLYGVKIWAERTISDVAPASMRAGLHVRFAQERLAEAEAMARQGRGTDAKTALDLMRQEIRDAKDSAGAAPTGQIDSISAKLAQLSLKQQAVLDRVIGKVPAPALKGLRRAKESSSKNDENSGPKAQGSEIPRPPGFVPSVTSGTTNKGGAQGGAQETDLKNLPGQQHGRSVEAEGRGKNGAGDREVNSESKGRSTKNQGSLKHPSWGGFGYENNKRREKPNTVRARGNYIRKTGRAAGQGAGATGKATKNHKKLSEPRDGQVRSGAAQDPRWNGQGSLENEAGELKRGSGKGVKPRRA